MSAPTLLSQSPLIHVVAQIDFSELPKFDANDIDQLHSSLFDIGFPERVNSSIEEVEWAFKTSDTEFSHQKKRKLHRYIFKGPGQYRLIELRCDCLLFKVTDYLGHDDFLAELDKILELLPVTIPSITKALLHRLSLRYIDLIVPKEDEKLHELVDSSLLPPSLPGVDGTPLFGSTMKVLKTGKDRHFQIAFEEVQPQNQQLTKVLPDDLIEHSKECGLSIATQQHWHPINKTYGLLDINHVYLASDKPPVNTSSISKIFQELHETTSTAFWKLITEKAKQSWK